MTSLHLANTDDPQAHATDLRNILAVVLNFPKFTDGRAFSQAALLRERMGYNGEIHATGDVLVDQLLQMRRCGFTHAILRADQDIHAGQQILSHYDRFYQTDPLTNNHTNAMSNANQVNVAQRTNLDISLATAACERATILYAHGSKDAAWVGTVERIAHTLVADSRAQDHISTAYVEHASPTLKERVQQVIALGVKHIRIYPLFVGAGFHVKNDVLGGVEALKIKYPHLKFEILPILGEDSLFIDFLATQIKAKVHGSHVTTD